MLDGIRDLVIQGEDERLEAAVRKALEDGFAPSQVIDVLTDGMGIVGDKFQSMEMFLPEMMLAADAMHRAVVVLKPALEAERGSVTSSGTVVIATVEGDIHDIGKTIVAAFLSVSGFDVIDMGRDVPAKALVQKAVDVGADVVAVSALLTSTMNNAPDVITEMEKAGMRCMFIVGGAPVTEEWAAHVGADGTAKNAPEAADLCRRLVEAKRLEESGVRPPA